MSEKQHLKAPRQISELFSNMDAYVLVSAWKECAGPVLCAQVDFCGVSQNAEGLRVLELRVQDPIWRQELEFQKKDIVERYNQSLLKLSKKSYLKVDLCSFGHSLSMKSSMPVKALHSQKSRNIKRIKR